MKRILAAIALIAVLVAVAVSIEETPAVPARPPVIVDCLDPSLEPYAKMWGEEVARRSQNAAVVVCHGADYVPGDWTVKASMSPGHFTKTTDLIDAKLKQHKGRQLFIVSCNPGHIRLTGYPGVFYALDNMFCIPDRELTPSAFLGDEAFKVFDGLVTIPVFSRPLFDTRTRWERWPGCVGNVWEMVEAK